MSNTILIIGESGSGKSTAIRTLDPKETFIINVLGKDLPFKESRKNYTKATTEGGNVHAVDSSSDIVKAIKRVNEHKKEIKNLVIDDFQYVMANEFMKRSSEKGYEKFTEIGKHAWEIINESSFCRSDLNVFVMSHSDTDTNGKSKCKTIGKMLDDKICIEGMFTVVLFSMIVDNDYKFLTQNDGQSIAKSPMGMFDNKLIPNDLGYVLTKMKDYFGDLDLDVNQ